MICTFPRAVASALAVLGLTVVGPLFAQDFGHILNQSRVHNPSMGDAAWVGDSGGMAGPAAPYMGRTNRNDYAMNPLDNQAMYGARRVARNPGRTGGQRFINPTNFAPAPYDSGQCGGGQCDSGQCGGGDYCMDGCGSCYDDCACGCGCDCCDVCCEPMCCCCCEPCCRCFAFTEYLYLNPSGVSMAHAQQQDGTGGAGTVPFGEIGTVDPSYHSGYRVGAGIACDGCNRFTISYLWFESDAVSFVTPPQNVGGGGGSVGSLVQHPNANLTASDGPVSATYDIDMQLADVMYRRTVWCNPCAEVGLSLGAVLGHLEQGFTQNGVFGGGNAGTIDTRTNIDFDGGGIKFGIDGEWGVACCGRLSVYGKGSVAGLTGKFRSNYQLVNSTTQVMLANANWDDDRVATIVDYEVGVGYRTCSGCCRASVGYLFSHWTNSVTTPEFVDAVQADNYVNLGDTVSFSGLAGRVEFWY